MNQKDFDEIVQETVKTISDLLIVKGGEYAGSEDRLANFKRGAKLTGVKPLTVCLIYLSKHYDAIATYVRDQEIGRVRKRSETIEGRLDDLINYCILAKALIHEGKSAQGIVAGTQYDPAQGTVLTGAFSEIQIDEISAFYKLHGITK